MTSTEPIAPPVTRPPRRRSLRLRLTAVYTLLFLLGGTALLAVTYLLVEQATGNQITYVSPDGHHTISFSDEATADEDQGSPGSASQNLLVGGSEDGLAPPPDGDSDELRSLALQQHADTMHQMLLKGGLALGVVTVAAAGLGWYLSGRVLTPLRTITGTVREITVSNLHRRLALPGRGDELTELGDTFDSLLDRLEASFDAQRQFVANASHELRTPLARQRAIGQIALDDPDASAADLRLAHEKILAAGREQERLIAALLDLARGQTTLQRRVPVDLRELVDTALAAVQGQDTVRNRARRHLEPATTVGDPRLIERLVVNLVTNAFRHSPAGSPIDLTTATRGTSAVFSITNPGVDLTDDDVATLMQPFRRGVADRTARDHGLGLGLAIVQAVARAHDAALDVSPRQGGGLSVRVTFAAAPPRPVDDADTSTPALAEQRPG